MGQKPALIGNLGERVAYLLRDYAAAKDVLNASIAEGTGLSEATISRIFNGKRGLYLSELEEICKALGLTSWKVVREAEDSLEVVESPVTFDPRKLGLAAQEDYSDDESDQ